MRSVEDFGRVLVIAPHPDDEVLGCGGTMARLSAHGNEVHVLVATEGKPPQFSEQAVERVRTEMRAAHEVLGIFKTHQVDLPAAALGNVPSAQINAKIGEVIESIRPDTLLLPFVGDIHADHQIVFMAAMVAARPRHQNAPSQILCYETLSETNWYAPPTTPAFVPNVYVDIAETLSKKAEAFQKFESQVRPFPEERSVEAIEALAKMRGATVFLHAAEAFMNIRQILR